MKFLIITFAPLLEMGSSYYSYGPYVTEMNIWLKYTDEVAFCCPTTYLGKDLLLSKFAKREFKLFPVPEVEINDILKPWKLYKLIFQLIKAMRWADHVHLRCPGNVGLIGCLVQIFFPNKKKTAKYAGNWDWKSKQPWSYRLQQRILRNTFLTHNMTTLVYGDWPDRTKNNKPFFTASYSENDRLPVSKRPLNEVINLTFVGTLTENKSPLLSLEVLHELNAKGINATLTFCGDGPLRDLLEQKISEYGLHKKATLLGNVDAETVKEVLKKSHFLVFITKSEGWPKAVSEAMWWGCIPATTPVSCVPWMLDNSVRGELVTGEVTEITSLIEKYIFEQSRFNRKSDKAMEWARQYTLERFESEIKQLF